jgi:hypothetical protein
VLACLSSHFLASFFSATAAAPSPPTAADRHTGPHSRCCPLPPALRKAKSFLHLDPPVAAVEQPVGAEQHASAADHVADDVVADVQRRDAQHPEGHEAQQRERHGVCIDIVKTQPPCSTPTHTEGGRDVTSWPNKDEFELTSSSSGSDMVRVGSCPTFLIEGEPHLRINPNVKCI